MSTASYILSTSMAQSPSTPTQAISMSDEQMDLVEILRSGEDSRLRRHRPERNDGPALPAVVLFCGADQEIEDWDEHRPGFVQMLPDTAPPPARKRQKKSNGCGARIHARAVPERRWRGLLDGVSADVVPLQDEYFTFDMRRELLLGKERCGCARSGVGCAIWLVFPLNFIFGQRTPYVFLKRSCSAKSASLFLFTEYRLLLSLFPSISSVEIFADFPIFQW